MLKDIGTCVQSFLCAASLTSSSLYSSILSSSTLENTKQLIFQGIKKLKYIAA